MLILTFLFIIIIIISFSFITFLIQMQPREKIQGIIDLRKCTVIDQEDQEQKGVNYCFDILNTETRKTYKVAAESKEEKVRWLNELQIHTKPATRSRSTSGAGI